jgi:hypothetical protein
VNAVLTGPERKKLLVEMFPTRLLWRLWPSVPAESQIIDLTKNIPDSQANKWHRDAHSHNSYWPENSLYHVTTKRAQWRVRISVGDQLFQKWIADSFCSFLSEKKCVGFKWSVLWDLPTNVTQTIQASSPFPWGLKI